MRTFLRRQLRRLRNRNNNERILMIGNSFTYYNGMPRMLKNLIGKGTIVVDVSKGSMPLVGHLDSEKVRKNITGNYTKIVLQPQSMELATGINNINYKVVPTVEKMLNITDTSLYLYQTYGYCDSTFESMSSNIKYGSNYLENRFGDKLKILRVGEKWSNLYNKLYSPTDPYGPRQLYNIDCHHPSYKGSFFIALSIFKLMFPERDFPRYNRKFKITEEEYSLFKTCIN